VPQEFLHRPNVVTAFQQVGGSGKSHCQRQSAGAFGYLRSKASGICTRPQPSAKSF
jgi:hypothetical protein